MNAPLPVAVLISGSGSTLKNLIDRQADGRLPIDIRLVVSSDPQAGGLDHARRAGIATHVAAKPRGVAPADYREQVFGPIRAAGAKLVVMAGFLKHVLIPADFAGRVINIHPALIPAFCGHGYYGRRVHQAVLEYGVKLTGCTVHFVDDEYDHGPIVLQRTVEVRDDDTPESLAARVQAAEREALPEAIAWIAAGRVTLAGRRVRVAPE